MAFLFRFSDMSVATVASQVTPDFQIYSRRDSAVKTNNTDLSECSTNTDEYITCTDTSRRTPGIKTPPTTTSSSSTTQVPGLQTFPNTLIDVCVCFSVDLQPLVAIIQPLRRWYLLLFGELLAV